MANEELLTVGLLLSLAVGLFLVGLVKVLQSRQKSSNGYYVPQKKKVGKCFGCGQCEKGCPLIIESRQWVPTEKSPQKRQDYLDSGRNL